MKLKLTVILAAFVVALGLLLGTSAAQAFEVITDETGTNATEIRNLKVFTTIPGNDGAPNTVIESLFDVKFMRGKGPDIYDELDFQGPVDAAFAGLAVAEALNSEPAVTTVGPVNDVNYFIPWGFSMCGDVLCLVFNWGQYDTDNTKWDVIKPGSVVLWFQEATYAKFKPAPQGDPVTIGGTVTGLIGSGLVLQNNGGDNLPIEDDGDFEFPTPLQPGLTYNVTVLTNPTNPTQICSVENGSGQVPDQAVTDVAVSCAEPVLGDVSKLAAVGDTLGDTVLTDILLDGGVAINIDGKVAFGGKDDDGTDAVFTQAGKVVTEGDTLEDGTILAAFRGQGEVGISSGQSGDRVAFHGMAESGLTDTAAVLTQAGKIAAVGDTLVAGITVDDIDPEGKVAINNFDQVAFHGSVEIEGGLFDEQFRVVFISDGVETREAAREASILPDGTPLDDINESGGVAINDADEVAFHGQSVFPDSFGDSLKAVFTSEGLAAKEGTDLDDGTILDDINENGGVAINLFSEVAFHGQTVVPDTGGDSVKAVFISDGQTTQVVAKEGDILPDETLLEEIEVVGGVAINLFGDVAFHGRTGGVKAVFISDGETTQVVAKVGDNDDDGNTLSEISDNAGVAINPYGFDVAFHGRIGTTDAVFVGQAPVADGEETSGE